MRRLLVLVMVLAAGCTLDPLFFSYEKHDGPYVLSDAIVPKGQYDPNGIFTASLDGTRLNLLYIQPSGGDPVRQKTTILFCHGNGGNVGSDTHWLRAEAFYQMGYRVLSFDYRGYGRSDGSPTEEGLYEDAQAMWAWLRQQPGVDPGRIVLYGHSLGTAVCTDLAVYVAGQPRDKVLAVKGLVLEAPFRSIADLVTDNAGASLPAGFLTTLSFDTYDKISKIDVPLLVMHGTADSYLMTQYGIDVYDRAADPKTLWLVPGAEHSTIPDQPGTPAWQAYKDHVTGFIDPL